jgi:hypothetical protein
MTTNIMTYTTNHTNVAPQYPVGQLSGYNHHDAYIDDVYEDKKTKLFNATEILSLLDAKRFVYMHMEKHLPVTLDKSKIVVAGGCFASLLNGEYARDYDVFLLDDEHNRNIAKGLSKLFENNHNARIGNSDYMNNDKVEHTLFFHDTKIQYVTTKYKTREELVKHFDFRHCCVSYDFATDKLYITREVYDLIRNKILKKNTDKVPAMWRYEKFVNERGWKVLENTFHPAYVTWKG